jgi:hypothetical protein
VRWNSQQHARQDVTGACTEIPCLSRLSSSLSMPRQLFVSSPAVRIRVLCYRPPRRGNTKQLIFQRRDAVHPDWERDKSAVGRKRFCDTYRFHLRVTRISHMYVIQQMLIMLVFFLLQVRKYWVLKWGLQNRQVINSNRFATPTLHSGSSNSHI